MDTDEEGRQSAFKSEKIPRLLFKQMTFQKRI